MISFNIHKTLQSAQGKMVLDISCDIQKGDFTTIYGVSGAGKTTTLRILAGLMNPEKGYIKIGDQVWFDSDKKINIQPQNRNIGFVFQDYALFPNMTVKENLEYALEKRQNNNIIYELIEMMELEEFTKRKPVTLSGGQKQRVALARAIVRKPSMLLLDEPLSALDISMRGKLQDYIIRIHKHYKLTTILVSHDISEIFKMSDKVFILEEGKIKKKGTPATVFSSHRMSGKFQFIGEVVDIEKEDIVYIVSVLIGNDITKVVATKEEITELAQGDKVIVASKAFNPLIKKIL